MQAKMIDEIMAKFTAKTLPLIEGETDYGGINKMMKLLYANVENFLTTHKGGHHRYIVRTMNLEIYTTLTTTVWTKTPKPEVYPMIPMKKTIALQTTTTST